MYRHFDVNGHVTRDAASVHFTSPHVLTRPGS